MPMAHMLGVMGDEYGSWSVPGMRNSSIYWHNNNNNMADKAQLLGVSRLLRLVYIIEKGLVQCAS